MTEEQTGFHPPDPDPNHSLGSLAEDDAQVEQVRRAVREAIKSGGLSQNKAAKEAGFSEGLLSQFLGGKYEGNNATVAAKLRAWLGGRAATEMLRRAELSAPGFIQTETAEAIFSALEAAQARPGMAAIIGASGVGKTTAAEQFRATRSNVWMLTATPKRRSAFQILQEAALALGTRTIGTGGELERAIMARLRGTRGLLIVDEAQRLDREALETLRGFYDLAGIGVAVLGDPGLAPAMAQLDQFARRLARRRSFERPTEADVAAFTLAYGITDNRMIAFLSGGPAAAGGSLGSVEEVIRAGTSAARAAGEPLQLDHLKLAWRELNLRSVA